MQISSINNLGNNKKLLKFKSTNNTQDFYYSENINTGKGAICGLGCGSIFSLLIMTNNRFKNAIDLPLLMKSLFFITSGIMGAMIGDKLENKIINKKKNLYA